MTVILNSTRAIYASELIVKYSLETNLHDLDYNSRQLTCPPVKVRPQGGMYNFY